MYKLVLNVGDKVRNINKYSNHKREIGVVISKTKDLYYIRYQQSQVEEGYIKSCVHKYLEKVEDPTHQCTCTHSVNESHVCARCTSQMLKVFNSSNNPMSSTRTTLKKERRNVVTGKTQSEMIKLCGTALGVTQFNTRALGKSTGQAMVKIGEAMMHPNVPVRIMDIDHAITEQGAPRNVANKNFAAIVNHIIKKQGLLGFIVNEAHLVYCPIVTEETYVNI
ncbi:hypothetical protein P4331_47 [Escherichia phage vB_EcolP_P433.1]|uniref:Uncharacterized protein n=1 Tax=Escherichia phage vB_EcolP_P433.1 TaxID=2653657 RepID=A0AAE6P049_9CAUD|nr:hypothetical protein P4331_47 [Escherichia phage vB_EcolP_P433.1]